MSAGNETDEAERARRWRLVLGETASEAFGGQGQLHGGDLTLHATLSHLFDDDAWGFGLGAGTGTGGGRGAGAASGGGSTQGSGAMTTTEWINHVNDLFPRHVAERLVDEALDKFGFEEFLADPELLNQVQPSTGLLGAILATKDVLAPEVLDTARGVVRQVVDDLMRRLRSQVMEAFGGTRNRQRRSRHRVAANFDAVGTVRANLRNLDPATGKLVISQPLFLSRTRRQAERWQVIVCVDQSGSMSEAVIHSAITASIFTSLDVLSTHLVVFDTEVVDLTDTLDDPVETLMSVQLGGGTNIAKALAYCGQLVDQPSRAIVVLISDFEEPGGEAGMYAQVRALVGSGVTVLGLSALDLDATEVTPTPEIRQLARRGAHVAAMTPDALAEWVHDVVTGRRAHGAAEPLPPQRQRRGR